MQGTPRIEARRNGGVLGGAFGGLNKSDRAAHSASLVRVGRSTNGTAVAAVRGPTPFRSAVCTSSSRVGTKRVRNEMNGGGRRFRAGSDMNGRG